jgi:hypothetical protein
MVFYPAKCNVPPLLVRLPSRNAKKKVTIGEYSNSLTHAETEAGNSRSSPIDHRGSLEQTLDAQS